MIIRAKDLASRELNQIGLAFTELDGKAQAAARSHIQQGSALMGIGVAMGATGAAALAFYGSSAKAAMEYNRESALTLTQVDQLGVKLSDIEGIGIRVARAVPAPFKEMQKSLYDIFSSMNVNVKEAEVILTAFSKGAVAGQTDVQTAGRATIAIMNAFKIPVEDVNKVMDIQFQTVRKGVVTYEEFARSIGRAIPSAVRAGASIQELGGAIAFATRNGLSAAMAATGVARAFDLLSNPVFAKNMKAYGIEVTNADGSFRRLVDVTNDLKTKFKGLSESQISEKLKDLTHGAGGTIQAMRVLNLAVTDSKGLFTEMTDAVNNSGGAFDEAYKIMKNTPASKIQELRNAFDILKVTIGDGVLPILGVLAVGLKKVIDWFLDLDPHVRTMIIRAGFLAAVFVTLTGVLTAVGGAVLILVGVFELMSGAMLPILAAVAGFALLSAAIIYLVTQTQIFQNIFQGLSDFIQNSIWPRIQELKKAFDADGLGGMLKKAGEMWQRDWPLLLVALGDLGSRLWQWITEAIPTTLAKLQEWGTAVGDWISNTGYPAIRDAALTFGPALWEWISENVPIAFGKLVDFVSSIGAWISDTGYPILKEKASTWGPILWGWIEDAVGSTVDALGRWGTQAVNWIKDTAVPWITDSVWPLGLALIKWIADALPTAIVELGKFLSALIQRLGDEAPKWIEKGGEILNGLLKGLLDNLPALSLGLLQVTAVVLAWVATQFIPAVLDALGRLAVALTEATLKIGWALLKVFGTALANVVDFIAGTLIPGILTAMLELPSRFAQNVAKKIEDAIISPFKSIYKKLVGNSIVPDLVDDTLAEWDRLADKSGTKFNDLHNDLVSKTTTMKSALTKLFQETGDDSFIKLRDALDQMPPNSERVSKETYDAVTSAISGLPSWTQGAGNETQSQWVAQLGKGTGGTRGTTSDWANAMQGILNELLKGVGAPPIPDLGGGGGDFKANGGIVEFMAKGGVKEDHMAQIAKAGDWRVWAEPETGGEAYIPLARGKRERSTKILQEVAKRFGMTVAEYADGGANWPGVPDFGAFGNMIGTRGGTDPTEYTRQAVVAWDDARKKKLAEEAAKGIGGGSLGGSGWQAITNYLDSQSVPYTVTSTTGGQHAPGSYHYLGKAVDMVSDNMMQIFNTLTQVGSSLAELFYDPAGWSIKNGARGDFTVGGHDDHVHAAVMDQGGVLQAGMNMIQNNTGKPEAVFNAEQFRAVEWLMGHAQSVTEAAGAIPPPAQTEGLQAAVGAVSSVLGAPSGTSPYAVGGRPGYAPSLGMMMDTVGHTVGLLGGVQGASQNLDAVGALGGSLAQGIGSNIGNPAGIGAANAMASGPMFSEGAIQMQITGSNPEAIAEQVNTKIRSLIAELRMR